MLLSLIIVILFFLFLAPQNVGQKYELYKTDTRLGQYAVINEANGTIASSFASSCGKACADTPPCHSFSFNSVCACVCVCVCVLFADKCQANKHCELYFIDDNHPFARSTWQIVSPGYKFYVRR
jgi:hypothetical protein